MQFERRHQEMRFMTVLAPLIAIFLTMVASAVMFFLLGKDPIAAIKTIFFDPLFDPYSRTEILVKAAPLLLISIGLSIGFKAGIWNIGAEGQFIIGALAGGSVGLAFYDIDGVWLLPLMTLAGALGGFLWAMIPAFLKIRFNTSEILVSLMLVYVAELLLSALVAGPLRDPDGFNFPESRLFHDSATLPLLLTGSRIHIGVAVAFGAVIAAYIMLERHIFGFHVALAGEAPRAARLSGVNPNKMVALCLGLGGALAGVAGLFETAGPIGQLVPSLPQGYGFTAIIVAFLGRLNPVGILLASLVLALTYIGGEKAQLALNMPASAIPVFQGMLLFFLLAVDIFNAYKLSFSKKSLP